MTPVEASKKENERTVYENLIGASNESISISPKLIKLKFKEGDRVRISKKKGIFEKGYTNRWTTEIFVISKIRYTNPITYEIKDLNNK
jgi:hypothetical protein